MSQQPSILYTNELAKLWGRRRNLDNEIYTLELHAIYARALIEFASRTEGENPALDALLLQLQLLLHDADAVFKELDYFRVQDELDGSNRAVGVPPKGCINRLRFHACHMARAAATKLKRSSSSDDTAKFIEKLASVEPCVGNKRQVQAMKTPQPKFNRVLLSKKMTDIVEKLKPLCSMVSTIINQRLIVS